MVPSPEGHSHAAGRGKLQVVATPIGNLGDITERARQALAEADLVACEDTRHTGRLLAHLGIRAKLVSLHEHNERQRLASLISAIETGQVIALVSDAGTPLVSDPGYLLVRAAAEKNLRIEVLPGPSAPLAALVASGLPPYPFTFAGFPPPKSGKRRTFYRRFADLGHTLVLFESPHRILKSLADAQEELGDRAATLARELTKLHEEVLRGTISEIRAKMMARSAIKGELVLVIAAGD